MAPDWLKSFGAENEWLLDRESGLGFNSRLIFRTASFSGMSNLNELEIPVGYDDIVTNSVELIVAELNCSSFLSCLSSKLFDSNNGVKTDVSINKVRTAAALLTLAPQYDSKDVL